MLCGDLVKVKGLVTHSCPDLCNPMDCSSPGSSIHGNLQTIILPWVPFPSPGFLTDPGIEPRSPTLQAEFLKSEYQGSPKSERNPKKKRCIWTVLLEKTLDSLLDYKKIKPVSPKRKWKPWLFIGRTDAEAPILWPPDVKSWFAGKDPDAGKDWGQEKWVTEEETVGQYHWLNGHEFEQALGDLKDREVWHAALQGGRKKPDATKQHIYMYGWFTLLYTKN